MVEMTETAPGPGKYHCSRLRVPLYEVDLGQGVYHGNYFHLLETAREDFLRHIGFPYRSFMDRETHLAVVEIASRYRRPLHYDDRIEIHTGIDTLKRRSLRFRQLIYRAEEGRETVLCNDSQLTMVCVRFSGGATVLPSRFVTCVEAWLGSGSGMGAGTLG